MINLHVYKYNKRQVYIEGHFQAHIGTDLVVMGEAKPICFKVTKSSTLQEFKVSLAKQMVSLALSILLPLEILVIWFSGICLLRFLSIIIIVYGFYYTL